MAVRDVKESEFTDPRPTRSLLFICVYLQAEAGGYSRRANLASQAAGRHTHPGCAVDLEESGAPSQHPPPLAFPVPRYRSSDHPNTPPPYRTSSMRIYLGESAAESPTPPFPLTSCLVSDGWTTPHLVSMIWKDMLVNDEHLTKVCDDWMPHIYWSGTKTSFENRLLWASH